MDSGRDLKLVVYIVLGAGLVLVTLGRLIYNDLLGTSELYVYAPARADAQVSIDGDAPVLVPAGGSKVLEARRGRHELVSTVNGEKFSTTVKLGAGGPQYAVPTTANQCFAVADASRLYTYSAWDKGGPASVEKRYDNHQAVKLPRTTFRSATAIPASTKTKYGIYVVQAFDCDELRLSDGALLAMMGL